MLPRLLVRCRPVALALAVIASSGCVPDDPLVRSLRNGDALAWLVVMVAALVVLPVGAFLVMTLAMLVHNLWGLASGRPVISTGITGAVLGAVLALAVEFFHKDLVKSDVPEAFAGGISLGVSGLIAGLLATARAWRLKYPVFEAPPDR